MKPLSERAEEARLKAEKEKEEIIWQLRSKEVNAIFKQFGGSIPELKYNKELDQFEIDGEPFIYYKAGVLHKMFSCQPYYELRSVSEYYCPWTRVSFGDLAGYGEHLKKREVAVRKPIEFFVGYPPRLF